VNKNGDKFGGFFLALIFVLVVALPGIEDLVNGKYYSAGTVEPAYAARDLAVAGCAYK